MIKLTESADKHHKQRLRNPNPMKTGAILAGTRHLSNKAPFKTLSGKNGIFLSRDVYNIRPCFIQLTPAVKSGECSDKTCYKEKVTWMNKLQFII